MLCGVSVYYFCKVNYCVCIKVGDCDNFVNYFLLKVMFSVVLLFMLCCIVLYVEKGMLLWLVLMMSCFSGVFILVKCSVRKCCVKFK